MKFVALEKGALQYLEMHSHISSHITNFHDFTEESQRIIFIAMGSDFGYQISLIFSLSFQRRT